MCLLSFGPDDLNNELLSHLLGKKKMLSWSLLCSLLIVLWADAAAVLVNHTVGHAFPATLRIGG